jgi:hypothetical protein
LGKKFVFKLFNHESQIKELSQFGDGHSSRVKNKQVQYKFRGCQGRSGRIGVLGGRRYRKWRGKVNLHCFFKKPVLGKLKITFRI